jgi:F-type H+-transporting ATPase subunit epsilon
MRQPRANHMKLKIVTPDRVLLEQEIDSVTVPTQTGEITILKNHIPLVSNLKPGELKFATGNDEQYFAVSGGFVEVRDTGEVIVLADTAEFGHEIDPDRAEKARQTAQQMMQDNYHNEQASADAVALLEKNLARLRVARKHRTKTDKNLESGILRE